MSGDNPFGALQGLDLPAGTPVAQPTASQEAPKVGKRRETLLLRRLKAGKGGKVVTEISGFKCDPGTRMRLLKELQSAMGTGGTCKGAILELQGECREKIKPVLESKGYSVKGI